VSRDTCKRYTAKQKELDKAVFGEVSEIDDIIVV
jgi:hypothetical protein